MIDKEIVEKIILSNNEIKKTAEKKAFLFQN